MRPRRLTRSRRAARGPRPAARTCGLASLDGGGPLSERGSGGVLAVAVLAACVIVGSAALSLAGGLATRQQVVAAADAAALAAADTALGLVPGDPCRSAARLAAEHGAGLAACRVEGLVVTVTTTRVVLGVAVSATARAGPP